MATTVAGQETPKDFGANPKGVADRWKMELNLARKSREKWEKRVKKIVKRYADDRTADSGAETDSKNNARRINILWSNIQTLRPAIYAKTPKPVVERRYLDRDPVGRAASTILERALAYEIEVSAYHDTTATSVLDYLLAGQGVSWVRYEPQFAQNEVKLSDDGEPKQPEAGGVPQEPSNPASSVEVETEDGGTDADTFVKWERLAVDYVHWSDFMCSPARVWDEVTWIAKRVHLTRDNLCDKFGDEIGKKVPLDYRPDGMGEDDSKKDENQVFLRACVWEIWDKSARKVCWISEGYEVPLKCVDDPLNLESFWPMPRPLFTTMTNDSILPIPDYTEYQDQAQEMDDLTARIGKLTEAIKAAGVYDASVPELKRLLEEGSENKLYPIDSWAAFVEKGGMAGAVSLLPIKELAEVLIRLTEAREQVKADLYEVTGISDIVRGQTAASETATAQQIKSNFATLRLDDRKAEVSRFCRDLIRIMAEIISEHFSPDTLKEICGWKQYAESQPGLKTQVPQMGHNGGPPMPGMPPMGMPPGPMGMMMPPPDPAEMMFAQALQLLRDEKTRGFRIDIETNSTVEPDQAQEKKDRTEFIGAISKFMLESSQVAIQQPKIVPLLGKLMLFGARAFPAARDLEASIEQFVNEADQAVANPPPPKPNPDEVKAQMDAEAKKQDMAFAGQKHGMEMQALQANTQAQLQIKQAEIEFKREELELKREELAMKREEMHMDMAMKAHDVRLKEMESLEPSEPQEDPLDREEKTLKVEHSRVDLEGKRKALESDGLKAETDQKDSSERAKHSESLNNVAEKLTTAIDKMDQRQDKSEEMLAGLVKAISAPKRGRKNPDGSLSIETVM